MSTLANGPSGLRRLVRFAATLALPGLLLTTGCKKEDELDKLPGTQPISSLELLKGEPDKYSTLLAALEKTGIDSRLGGITLLAPTNSAFQNLPAPFQTAQSIKDINDQGQIDFLRSVLLYHVLGNKVKAEDISTGLVETFRPAGEGFNKVFVTHANSITYLNGNARIIYPNIATTDGMVHTLNNVLLPPTQNIVEVLQNNPNFTTLVAAVVKTDLANTLSDGAGNFTVFAPTNAAFRALEYKFRNFRDTASIRALTDPASIDTLKTILLFHTLNNRVFSPSLTDTLVSSVPGPINRIAVDGLQIKAAPDSIDSNITGANLMLTNGVLHVIDRVMRPVRPQ